jgi:hypothetical protein
MYLNFRSKILTLPLDASDIDKSVLVNFGEKYGPPEESFISSLPKCSVGVQFKAPCGHIMQEIPCNMAFEMALGQKKVPECLQPTQFSCPVCRYSNCTNACWVAQFFASWKLWNDEENETERSLQKNAISGRIRISEAVLNSGITVPDIPAPIGKLFLRLCNAEIDVYRTCTVDHFTSVPCRALLLLIMGKSKLSKCEIRVDRQLSCKHSVQV